MKKSKAFLASIGMFVIGLASAPLAFAHAVLVHSTPADHSVVQARTITLLLQYNSRIDAARSSLTLTDAGGKSLPLQMESSGNAGELKAVAPDLANGQYRIHWQVLASDGHITRGEVNFFVKTK